MSLEREASIIETTAHTKPMTLFIETQQRCDNEIQPLRFTYRTTAEERFRYVETVELHRSVRRPWHEPEATGQEGVQYRQVAMLAHGIRQMQQWHGIDLALAGHIGRNAPGAFELRQCTDAAADGERGLLLLFGGELLAPAA